MKKCRFFIELYFRVREIRMNVEFPSAHLTLLSQDIADYKNIKKNKIFEYPATRKLRFQKWAYF